MASCPKVTNCRFLRLGCQGDQHELFSASYVRSNTKRSAKLLRCFPHCCPDHKERSYCGCSLHLLVNFEGAEAATSADRDRDLVVCARFEAAAAVVEPGMGDIVAAMFPGAMVGLPGSALRQTGEKAAESDWVRAEKASESHQQQFGGNAILYVLNNHRSPEWSYGYESGSTNAQREMKHVLAAYMFLLHPLSGTSSQTSDEVCAPSPAARLATVIYRQTSTSFTMVSYRRQRSTRRSGKRLPSTKSPDTNDGIETVASDTRELAPELESPPAFTTEADLQNNSVTQHAQLRTDGEEICRDLEDKHSHADVSEAMDVSEDMDTSGGVTNVAAHSSISSLGLSPQLETKSLQRTLCCQICCDPLTISSHPLQFSTSDKTTEHLQALLLLQLFGCFTPAEEFSFYFDEIDSRIQNELLARLLPMGLVNQQDNPTDASERRTKIQNTASTFSLERFVSRQPQTQPIAAKNIARKQAVLRSCADLLLDTLSSTQIQRILARRTSNNAGGQGRGSSRYSSLSESCEQFSGLVEDLFNELTQLLVARSRCGNPHFNSRFSSGGDGEGYNRYSSIPELVDDILSVIYTEPEFQELCQSATALLLRKHRVWEASVQRLFQSFLTQQLVSRDGRCYPGQAEEKSKTRPPRPDPRSMTPPSAAWNQRWFFNPASLSLRLGTAGTNGTASVDSSTAPSLLSIVTLIHMLACVDVQLEGNQLTIASETNPTASAMVLVLDGQTRDLDSLPNGLSPTAGAALYSSHGGAYSHEYEGNVSADGNSLDLLLLALPPTVVKRQNSPADVHVRLALGRQERTEKSGLSVFAEVSASVWASTMEVRATYVSVEK